MEAILIDEATNELYFTEVADPVPKENELVVRIKSTALNRADILQRYGQYPLPPGANPIPGLEMSGIVESVGSNVKDFKEGDRVFSLLSGGGYAEKVAIPSDLAIRIPSYFSFEQAAAIPEAYLTAYLNLFLLGNVQPTDHVLIHAGASGVGLAATQIVNAVGATAIVTASSEKKLNVCSRNGANFTINYKKEDFAEKVLEVTNGTGVQLILDFVGAPYWEKNIKSLSNDGILILIGLLGGTVVNKIDLSEILFRRLQIKATTLRSRTNEEKIFLTKQFAKFALPKFENRLLVPVIDSVYDWKDVRDAHERMETNKNIGKIILNIT